MSALTRSMPAAAVGGGSAIAAAAGAAGAAAGALCSFIRSRSALTRSIFDSSSPNNSGGSWPASSAVSTWLSMRWVSSPRRIAPAMRALPFSVCSARLSASAMRWSCGCAFQSRRSLPICGTSSSASSRNTGSRCASMSSRMTRCALRRAVICCIRSSASPASPLASPRCSAATMLFSLSITTPTSAMSSGSTTRPANGVHCSSSPARSATAANPAVREQLASVCAARMNSSGTCAAGWYWATRVATWPAASLR